MHNCPHFISKKYIFSGCELCIFRQKLRNAVILSHFGQNIWMAISPENINYVLKVIN